MVIFEFNKAIPMISLNHAIFVLSRELLNPLLTSSSIDLSLIKTLKQEHLTNKDRFNSQLGVKLLYQKCQIRFKRKKF